MLMSFKVDDDKEYCWYCLQNNLQHRITLQLGCIDFYLDIVLRKPCLVHWKTVHFLGKICKEVQLECHGMWVSWK